MNLFSFDSFSETPKRSKEVKAEEIPNSPQAQIEQVGLSNDIGMKCSQI